MNIVFFCHPTFMGSKSMPRFTEMLKNGMIHRGHTVDLLYPSPFFLKIFPKKTLTKWLGYIDQYILFPYQVKRYLKRCSPDTLYVFIDNALGPWVPLVNDRPHVIHCHDFLAQRSAKNEFLDNPTSFSGRLYQVYIRRGYRKGKNFISISNRTKEDLHKFLLHEPKLSKVVYNGFNQVFTSLNSQESRFLFASAVGIDLSSGYILHVGGNQWYKNRNGVIEIYNAFRISGHYKLPLILIGAKPNSKLLATYESSIFKKDIHFITDLSDEIVRLGYSGASVFLFPSIAEGFGWPISEAMASGCPVITTDENPMKEVGGDAAFYISRRPVNDRALEEWAMQSALVLTRVLLLSDEEKKKAIEAGILNAARFDTEQALDKIELIYSEVLMGV